VSHRKDRVRVWHSALNMECPHTYAADRPMASSDGAVSAGVVLCAVALGVTSTLAVAGEGIWKAVVPAPGSMKGEFENNDPIGLYAGVKIKADCSLNWTNPDDHRLYCFSSATSLVFFLDAPAGYLDSARHNWAKLKSAKG
jgi:hypothetical protein